MNLIFWDEYILPISSPDHRTGDWVYTKTYLYDHIQILTSPLFCTVILPLPWKYNYTPHHVRRCGACSSFSGHETEGVSDTTGTPRGNHLKKEEKKIYSESLTGFPSECEDQPEAAPCWGIELRRWASAFSSLSPTRPIGALLHSWCRVTTPSLRPQLAQTCIWS